MDKKTEQILLGSFCGDGGSYDYQGRHVYLTCSKLYHDNIIKFFKNKGLNFKSCNSNLYLCVKESKIFIKKVKLHIQKMTKDIQDKLGCNIQKIKKYQKQNNEYNKKYWLKNKIKFTNDKNRLEYRLNYREQYVKKLTIVEV